MRAPDNLKVQRQRRIAWYNNNREGSPPTQLKNELEKMKVRGMIFVVLNIMCRPSEEFDLTQFLSKSPEVFGSRIQEVQVVMGRSMSWRKQIKLFKNLAKYRPTSFTHVSGRR